MTSSAGANACLTLPASGKLDCSTEALEEAAKDFGHIIRKRPKAVFRPSSAAEIAEALKWAGRRGLKVAARGMGHSVFGRAMSDSGIVIGMRGMSSIHRVESDRVVVDAGATWDAVLEATTARGLTPPVLTNYLGLSIGGTLAAGGIGGPTSRYGMQTDNIFELDVVTGDGRQLTCSADGHADVFDAVRGGLGQCAVITRATLRLMQAPERVRRFQLFYPDLAALTKDQRLVLAEERFDQLQGAIVPAGAGGWRYQLEGAAYYDGGTPPDDKALLDGLSDVRAAIVVSDLTYREDARVFARLENMLRSNGQWFNPHPWLLTFLRGPNAEAVAREIMEGLTSTDVGPLGRIIFYPMRTDALRTPLVRMPDEDIVFPFNIIRIPEVGDMTAAQEMVARNRPLYDAVRKLGGVLYPVSAFSMTSEDWKKHFASSWPQFHAAKERYDPRRTLTPGYEIF